MLALPTLAWADPSPSNTGSGNATAPNGVTASVQGTGTIESVSSVNINASNVPEGTDIIASFEVKGNASNVNLTFNVGKQYAGHAFTVYIQHENSTEILTGTVDYNGNVKIHVDELSIFSIAIGDKVADTAANTGSTSPQTGVDLGTVAGATVVTAIAAGAVFVALRKKVTE